MKFNFHEELQRCSNEVQKPSSNELPFSESYFEAKQSEKVALNQLKLMASGKIKGQRYIKTASGVRTNQLRPLHSAYRSQGQTQRPQMWQMAGSQQIVSFYNDPTNLQRVSSAVTAPSMSEDARFKFVHKIQKVNNSFYSTLRANTIHKHNFEELIHAQPVQNNSSSIAIMTQLGRSGTFLQQAFRGNNLKYHLIRQLLEQKDPAQIQAIQKEITLQTTKAAASVNRQQRINEIKNSFQMQHSQSQDQFGRRQVFANQNQNEESVLIQSAKDDRKPEIKIQKSQSESSSDSSESSEDVVEVFTPSKEPAQVQEIVPNIPNIVDNEHSKHQTVTESATQSQIVESEQPKLQKSESQSTMKEEQVYVHQPEMTTRKFVYSALPYRSETDKRVSKVQSRKYLIDEKIKKKIRKGESCTNFSYRQTTALEKNKKLNSRRQMLGAFTIQEGLAEGIEVINFINQEQPDVSLSVQPARNLEEDIAVLDNHKQKLLAQQQQPRDFCMNVAVSALEMKQAPNGVDSHFTNFIRSTDQTVRQLKGGVKEPPGVLVSHLNADIGVNPAVTIVANMINQRGITNNKTTKVVPQSKYYLQLERERKQRKAERLQQLNS